MTFNKKSTNHHLETFSTCVSRVEHRGRPGEDGLLTVVEAGRRELIGQEDRRFRS